ncbi:fluoride efflux transporter CrcB [Nocardia colli]|uniref:Fluoride-specific ion channel FluC n=1 Tax=Nocardia colli TaxID=2545717 RepID=A0A5N0E7T5_9NOCA|nr:fluoride efflux transporter CrcB [Nocardia colli]KAA8885487.1 fluoride efflux transporter CrcB [Nocardia colli]
MPIDPRTPFLVDPDVDLHSPDQRCELGDTHGAILAVIAAGGALGALARYGLTLAWPAPPGGFPWAVFTINVAGSFLLGLLMVVITEIRPAHPLVRPFLGVGVLGGFTTFSTYANDIRALLDPDTVLIAALYLVGTLIAALVATTLAQILVRAVVRRTQVEVA